jgi:hypothetical protein
MMSEQQSAGVSHHDEWNRVEVGITAGAANEMSLRLLKEKEIG